jgi:hypothetical protein
MSSKIRRCVVIALTGLVAGAFGTGHASADTPETYVGSASGTALELSVLGQGLTLGHATATADSGSKASAQGAGVLKPAVEPSQSKADASGGTVASQPDRCATPPLPAQLAAVLNVGLACSSASADTQNNTPKASASGTVAKIDVGANTVLTQLPITQPIEEALEGILGQLPDQLDPVTNTVGQVLDGVLHTQTLAVKVGASTADVTTTAGAVTATSTAAGGQIDILPQGGLNGKPLASIVVGSAKATATYDRAAGKATPSVDPAIVRVVINTPLLQQEIPVAPGQDITILAGTPLESRIVAGSGKATTNPDGSVTAVADAVRLELLKGLNGGVVLGIGHAEAGAAGAPATQEPTRVLAETPRELPRTGGPIPALPVAGAGIFAFAIATRRFLGR